MTVEDLPPSICDAVARYATAARARFGARLSELRVFGSYARGDAEEHSDVDVFVVIDAPTYAETRWLEGLPGEILLDTQVLLSATVFSTADFELWTRHDRRLVRDAMREGFAV